MMQASDVFVSIVTVSIVFHLDLILFIWLRFGIEEYLPKSGAFI